MRTFSYSTSTETDLPSLSNRDLPDNNGLMPLQESSSTKEYASILAHFLLYLVRHVREPLDEEVDLQRRSITCIQRFEQACEISDNGQVSPGDADELEQALEDLLCDLFQRNIVMGEAEATIPVMNFLFLRMVETDGSYHPPEHLSHWLACLQYSIRLAFAVQFKKTSQHLKLHRPEQDDGESFQLPAIKKFEWLYKRETAPFNIMRQLMHHVGKVLYTDQMPDRTAWCDAEQETLMVGEHTVTVSGIRNAIHYVDAGLDKDYEALVDGCAIPDMLTAQYTDAPLNTSPGFNYLVNSRHVHQQYHLHMVKEWLKRGDRHGLYKANWQELVLADGFIPNGDMWNLKKVWQWLELSDRFLEKLYFLYHVACGQPKRGTEEVVAQIINTSVAPRSIFWRGKQFGLATWYHKTRNQTGLNKPRMTFLTGKYSKLLHIYLGFMRPVVV